MKQSNQWLMGMGILITAFAYVFSGYLLAGCVLCMGVLMFAISKVCSTQNVQLQLSDVFFFLPFIYVLANVIVLPYHTAKAIAFVGLGTLLYSVMMKMMVSNMKEKEQCRVQRWLIVMGIVIFIGMGLIVLWIQWTMQWVMIAEEVIAAKEVLLLDTFSLLTMVIPMFYMGFSSIQWEPFHQKIMK